MAIVREWFECYIIQFEQDKYYQLCNIINKLARDKKCTVVDDVETSGYPNSIILACGTNTLRELRNSGIVTSVTGMI